MTFNFCEIRRNKTRCVVSLLPLTRSSRVVDRMGKYFIFGIKTLKIDNCLIHFNVVIGNIYNIFSKTMHGIKAPPLRPDPNSSIVHWSESSDYCFSLWVSLGLERWGTVALQYNLCLLRDSQNVIDLVKHEVGWELPEMAPVTVRGKYFTSHTVQHYW